MQLTGKTGCWTPRIFWGKTLCASQAILMNQANVTFMTCHFKQITHSLRARRIPQRFIIRRNEMIRVKALLNVSHMVSDPINEGIYINIFSPQGAKHSVWIQQVVFIGLAP